MKKFRVSKGVICICAGLIAAGLENDVFAIGEFRSQDDARITVICDGWPMRRVLKDVFWAYGLNGIVVLNQDEERPRRDFYLKGASKREFFDKVTAVFPSYSYTHDPQTDTWFVYPKSGQDSAFFDTVDFGPIKRVSGIDSVTSCMSSVSNSWRIPNTEEYIRQLHGKRFDSSFTEPGYGLTDTVAELPKDRNVRWKRIAQIIQKMSRGYIFAYMTRSKELRGYEVDAEGPQSCFWAIGRTKDFSVMTDREIIAVLSKKRKEYKIIASQVLRMDEKRIWNLYELMEDGPRKMDFFIPLIQKPMIRYSDVAIRIALDNVRSSRVGLGPMYVLVHNNYSAEIMALVSELITQGDVEWQRHVYPAIEYAPTSISEETRNAWLAALEDGRRAAINMKVKHWSEPPSHRGGAGSTPKAASNKRGNDGADEQLKAALHAQHSSAKRLRSIDKARRMREKRRQAHLAVLGVDTNRSLSDVISSKGHNTDPDD